MKNFHTHTYRCKHATGDVEDYAAVAVQSGITVLGISDHTPLPDNRWPEIKMAMSELDEYILAIEKAKANYPGLRMYKGMECEYDRVYESFYRDELLGRYQLDYLIGGVHFFPSGADWKWSGSITNREDLGKYAEYFVTSMKSGLFHFMAHPDFYGIAYPRWDADTKACARYIFEAARDLKVPLEINLNGWEKEMIQTPDGKRPVYPIDEFWMMAADYGILALVNSDAHKPEQLAAHLQEGIDFANKLGVKIIDPEALIIHSFKSSFLSEGCLRTHRVHS